MRRARLRCLGSTNYVVPRLHIDAGLLFQVCRSGGSGVAAEHCNATKCEDDCRDKHCTSPSHCSCPEGWTGAFCDARERNCLCVCVCVCVCVLLPSSASIDRQKALYTHHALSQLSPSKLLYLFLYEFEYCSPALRHPASVFRCTSFHHLRLCHLTWTAFKDQS